MTSRIFGPGPVAFVICLILAGVSGLTALAQEVNSKAAAGSPVKVMSFNIRFGTADDGDNHWKHRCDLVAETIRLFDPDLLGVQEALDFQCDFLKGNLPTHEFFGRSREKNPTSGEFCGIYFRTGRFELIDSGHFWLSDRPDDPGSRSWDSSLPRMVSWVRLRDRESRNAEFVFANTHFDHRGKDARLQSAKLIRQRLVGNSSYPLIITGDFNCAPTSEPYNALVEPETDSSRRLYDSFLLIHPVASGQDGSTTGWVGNTGGARIDWVLHTDEFITLNADIDHTRQEGRFPSDHYPVNAILKLKLPGAMK